MEWDLKTVYGIGKDIVLLAAVLYTWWANREKVTAKLFADFKDSVANLEKDVSQRITTDALKAIDKERAAICDRHKERTDRNERELIRLAGEINSLPDHKDLARIHARIDEMSKSLGEITGEVKSIGHQVSLVLEELIKR